LSKISKIKFENEISPSENKEEGLNQTLTKTQENILEAGFVNDLDENNEDSKNIIFFIFFQILCISKNPRSDDFGYRK